MRAFRDGEVEHLPDDRRVGAEDALPVRVGQHGYRFHALALV